MNEVYTDNAEFPSINGKNLFSSPMDEIANTITHGIGTLGAITGLVFLCLKTAGFWNGSFFRPIDIVAGLIFTASMIGMFLVSTLYHASRHNRAKQILRKMDHAAIFIFIAGTYTPICLSGLGGGWGWSLFGLQWFLALCGIFLNSFGHTVLNSTLKLFFRRIELVVYLLMGWMIIIGFIPLFRSVPLPSVILLLAGGIAYSIGTIFYKRKNIRLNHAVWHLFVILGAVCHWFSIWFLHSLSVPN